MRGAILHLVLTEQLAPIVYCSEQVTILIQCCGKKAFSQVLRKARVAGGVVVMPWPCYWRLYVGAYYQCRLFALEEKYLPSRGMEGWGHPTLTLERK